MKKRGLAHHSENGNVEINLSPIFSSPILNLEAHASNVDTASFLDRKLSNSQDSIDSLYFGDCTPEIVDDITPSNLSIMNLVPEGEGRVINLENPDMAIKDVSFQGIQDILKNAGYSPSAIDTAVKSDESHEHESVYGRSRPRTQVFYQGKIFTYEKLEVPTGKSLSKRSRVISSSKEQKLNPEVEPFVPNEEANSIPLESSLLSLDEDALSTLKNIRISNLNNVIIGQLNINSLRNKFQFLVDLVHGNIDILVLTETKLDHTFPEKQFLIPGYKKPYRRDRNRNGGGVMIYVREDIPSDILIKHKTLENIEAIFVEINLRKNKLLLIGTYHSTNEKYGAKDDVYFMQIGLALDVYSTYDKFLIAGDLNVREEDDTLDEFMNSYHAKNLVKDPTCFKNTENPSCIDLFITNSYRSFQKTTTVTTGLSDFHKMTLTVLKTTFPKSIPKVICYRTPYEQSELEIALKRNLEGMTEQTYANFEGAVVDSYNSVSSTKQRTVRANEKPYVTKEMRRAIMLRSQLQNRKFKYGSEENIKACKKQENYCNRLYKRERRNHYNKLNVKDITDNNKFWAVMQPLFSDKGGIKDRIALVENNEIISESGQVAEIFNDYFQVSGSMKSLGITENKLLLNPVAEKDLDVDRCIIKFESHPSIIIIRRHVEVEAMFDFTLITAEDIDEQIGLLDIKKNGGCIPTKMLIECRDIVCKPLADIWNTELIKNQTFSAKLKLGDITPIFKTLQNTMKKNYRPITVLIVVSKMFERIMDKQTNEYMEKFLSKYLCGYRRNYSCQTAMVPMIENWKMARDKGEHAGGVMMDLSKAFDTINHELFIAKLHAYGFSRNALKIVHSYLSDRWHRTKIDGSYSSWKEILSGVPQGSVNGPKWFNIYLNDLFFLFLNTEACNIADDTTPYACDADLPTLLANLESDAASAILWYDANYMKSNQTKCHFMIASPTPEQLWIQIGEQIIWESKQEKLLGLTVDKKLLFDKHVEVICNNASAKVTALSRLIRIVSMEKKKILMNAFIESQFSHCPLVWMFCFSRKLNTRMNHIHERGLRIVYEDYTSTFEELLNKDGSVSIHHRNIQLVAIQMFKVKNGLCPKIMKDLFQLNTDPNCNSTFLIPKVHSEYMGKLSLRYFGPVVWETMLPDEYKSITILEKFQEKVKNWTPVCKCRLCKTYVAQVGFVEISK